MSTGEDEGLAFAIEAFALLEAVHTWLPSSPNALLPASCALSRNDLFVNH
jgi:hypothetical protein